MSRCAIHGFVVDSEVPLRGQPAAATTEPDLTIRWGHGGLREGTPTGAPIAEWTGPAGEYAAWRVDDGIVLQFPGICEFWMPIGLDRMVATPAHGERQGLTALLLAGAGLSLWLGLRGQAVIHANALHRNGRTMVISGCSGSGKSTSSALLAAREWRLAADDTVRLDVANHGVRCFQGARSLRLRPNASGLAQLLPTWPAIPSPDGRLCISDERPLERGPFRLDAVFCLMERADRLSLRRLAGTEALIALLAQARLAGWRSGTPLSALTAALGETARTVPVFSLSLPTHTGFDLTRAAELDAALTGALDAREDRS